MKRAVKTPKLYFLDTGLAAYLTKWNSPDVIEAGAMSGAFFESFVMAEILKSYYNAGILEPAIYYYRDKDAKEIDLIIEENGTLYPIEIKKTSNPGKEHIENFSVLDKVKGINVGIGCVICMYEKIIHINEKKCKHACDMVVIGYSYKLIRELHITSALTFSSEEKAVPIYKAPSLSKESSKKFAVNFFENINVDTSSLEIIDYHEEVVYWARGGKGGNSYNIWLNNIDGSFRFTDYSFFGDDLAPKEATEEVIKENLGYFDINIPEEAKFESETMGDYMFSIDKTVVDNKLIHGVLSCSYYNDDTIKNIDNNLVIYEKVRDVAVISEKQAYERITEGKFTYRKDVDIINTIELNDVAIDYRLDSKGYFQPVYIFNSIINDEPYSIVVPAIAK